MKSAKDQFIGSIITKIDGLEIGSQQVHFHTDNGIFEMYHSQDCCEVVNVDDIVGITDLIGAEVYAFIEKTNSDNPKPNSDSFTWTFYTLVTSKGYTDIKWYGESNGYYSESVKFEKAEDK